MIIKFLLNVCDEKSPFFVVQVCFNISVIDCELL